MQIQAKIPAFDHFSYLLAEADAAIVPSEIHGMLCGLICSGQRSNGKFWLDTALKLLEARTHIIAKHQAAVIELYDIACRQLTGLEGDFQLLLPSDEKSLPERAQALSQWCHGLISGLNLVGNLINEENEDILGDAKEAIRCMKEIATIDFDQIEVSEMDAQAYKSVTKFVSNSVKIIYHALADNTQCLH